MMPGTYNLDLYRGDTQRWQYKFWLDTAKTIPADLTDVTVSAMIRDKATGGAFSLSLPCAVTLPNIVDVSLTSPSSTDLPKKGVWDLQLTYLSGDVVTPLRGVVVVADDVTRAEAPPAQALRVVI